MDGILEITSWREVFVQAWSDLTLTITSSLPSLVAAIGIVLVGWLVAFVTASAVRRSLRMMGADRQHGRFGPAEMLEHAGILLPPSQVLSKLLFWLVLLFFVAFGLETLGVAAIDTTIDPVLAYLPRLIGATLIVLLGLLLARFLGTVVSSASAAAGFPNASRVGFFIQVLMGGLVVVLAAQRLGLAVAVLVAPFTALLAASGFAAGLAFALGARPIITHILAGHFLRQSLPRDAFVEIGGERGIVDRLGPTDTLLRSDKKTWSIPNARLLDEIVVR